MRRWVQTPMLPKKKKKRFCIWVKSLVLPLNTLSIKGKVDLLNFIKIKKVCLEKDTMKNKLQTWKSL
jgi:hypothetical protein